MVFKFKSGEVISKRYSASCRRSACNRHGSLRQREGKRHFKREGKHKNRTISAKKQKWNKQYSKKYERSEPWTDQPAKDRSSPRADRRNIAVFDQVIKQVFWALL